MVMVLLLAAWARVGTQVNRPVAGSTRAPAGAPGSRLKRKVLAGISGSVAVALNIRGASTYATWLLIASSTGGRFTSLTTMVSAFESDKLGVPLSRTMTRTT